MRAIPRMYPSRRHSSAIADESTVKPWAIATASISRMTDPRQSVQVPKTSKTSARIESAAIRLCYGTASTTAGKLQNACSILWNMRRQSWPDVRVACVWIAQLPLRVEILRHPAWDGRPLVLGGAPGERKIVQLCSPEAEAAGVRPGLPLREVVPLCPEAIVLQPDPVRTAAVLESVLADLQRVSPLVEPGLNEAGYFFLDLRGLRAMYGELAQLEEAIQAVVPPLLRPRLGFGSGKFAAAVAARMAAPGVAQVVPASETEAFLAPLSVRHLLLLEPDVLQRLELLGLHTIGDLSALPFNAVQAERSEE